MPARKVSQASPPSHAQAIAPPAGTPPPNTGAWGEIIVKGARTHNLRNLSLRIPRGRFVVFTGVSGSGKTSLVFDTIHAEGRRQYMESLSVRSRQWFGQMERPDVDYIQGLSPVIAVEQRTSAGANPRSTVATITETADYARLLWALAGEQRCPEDGGRILRKTLDDCLAQIRALPHGSRLILLAPFMRARPAILRDELQRLQLRGYQRVRINGEIRNLEDNDILPHGRDEVDVEIVIDRITLDANQGSRLADSLELAFREGKNRAMVQWIPPGASPAPEKTDAPPLPPATLNLALDHACERCGATYDTLTPRHFSHNHPDGACPACSGLGRTLAFQPALVVPNPALSIKDGAIKPWRLGSKRMLNARSSLLRQLATQVPFNLETPWQQLPEATRTLLLHGDASRIFSLRPHGRQKTVAAPFDGILADLAHTARETTSDSLRARLLAYQTASPCPVCSGHRLKPRSLAVSLNGLNFAQFLALPASEAAGFIEGLSSNPAVTQAEDARRGLAERLRFLEKTGLGYLALDREFGTLSGGETQRVRLATQLGLALVGVTYVLDEPSIGLHPADHQRLLNTLLDLRDRGNTLLVIEHDEATIRAADQIIEIGPEAGKHGGQLIYQGPPPRNPAPPQAATTTAPAAPVPPPQTPASQSRTLAYLDGTAKIQKNAPDRLPDGRWLTVHDASENNLRHLTARFPIGLLTVICGVSGSGKSTLVNDILAAAAAREINGAKLVPGRHNGITGLGHFAHFALVDQTPIGTSPRSTPATYTGLFDELRSLYAAAPLAKIRGYGPARFSHNVRGGRCERCAGDGHIALDMQFLGEITAPCPSCQGARYNRETLEIRHRGLNIAEVLALTVAEAQEFFRNHPKLQLRLGTLSQVGLGYLQLGQPADTLSGGEAQRLKLTHELARSTRNGPALYILDEPTTGLHWDDIQRLLDLLLRLRDAGNTLLVIEHHRDLVRAADWLLELGPGGGSAGGNLIYEGPPASLANTRHTPTGKFLNPPSHPLST
ncbi:MAG: excinuclease ABC subunit UvrA [Puniceicoccales bacterium]|jgi:excinuclease ABC subunit A|nr:excinuclease ABC subunit UvrA [Puniceicoccales bacterium]